MVPLEATEKSDVLLTSFFRVSAIPVENVSSIASPMASWGSTPKSDAARVQVAETAGA